MKILTQSEALDLETGPYSISVVSGQVSGIRNVLLNILSSSSINNHVDIESSTHSKQVSQISYEKVASQWKQCSMYEQEVPREAAVVSAWTRVRSPQ